MVGFGKGVQQERDWEDCANYRYISSVIPCKNHILPFRLVYYPDTANKSSAVVWVAVKELKLSYYLGETLLFTIYTHYGNLI